MKNVRKISETNLKYHISLKILSNINSANSYLCNNAFNKISSLFLFIDFKILRYFITRMVFVSEAREPFYSKRG